MKYNLKWGRKIKDIQNLPKTMQCCQSSHSSFKRNVYWILLKTKKIIRSTYMGECYIKRRIKKILTLTRSLVLLKRLHLRIPLRTGSFQSSTTLCVVTGGNPSLCKLYIQRFSLTISSLFRMSLPSGSLPLKTFFMKSKKYCCDITVYYWTNCVVLGNYTIFTIKLKYLTRPYRGSNTILLCRLVVLW